ncbi:hypothetical protein EDD16DRAFT_481323 [Pisolithus croceorrhizus]|nr:hypothetical protein EDD16DRAFT_481323 [Pisolithus croceorrhizus]
MGVLSLAAIVQAVEFDGQGQAVKRLLHSSQPSTTSSYMKMALHEKTMFGTLRRIFPRLLYMFGLAPEHPKINGLFTAYERSNFYYLSVEPWYLNCIRNNPDTWHCSVVEAAWYKKQNGGEHEFLRFDISSPDKRHTCIVIAERNGGGGNANRDRCDSTGTTDTGAPIDTVSGPVTPLGATGDSTSKLSLTSSSSLWVADGLISYATLDSRASAQLEHILKKATRVCSLTFSEKARPSANELATLLYLASKLQPTYTVTSTQCYWFVDTVFTALKSLFEDAEQDIVIHRGGTWNGVPIYAKESVKEVCGKYREARAALALEVEERCRLERIRIQQRQWEREQLQAAQVRAQAAEEIAQREREKRLAAEDRARAAEEQITRLHKVEEVWRAVPSTQQF